MTHTQFFFCTYLHLKTLCSSSKTILKHFNYSTIHDTWFPATLQNESANKRRTEHQTWLEFSCVLSMSRAADVSSRKMKWTQRKRKVRQRMENWEREWGERDKRIGRADFLSPIKATTPQCCYGDLLSLPSFQWATTYPCCLSVSRACGCVCFCVLAPEWIKQMKGKAIREPSQTVSHTHTQGHVYSHTYTH